MRKGMNRWLALAALTTVAACDAEGVTGASGDATMEVAVRGDSPSGASAYRAGGADTTDARIDVEARVWVQAETGEWVEVTQGTARQTVSASSQAEAKVLATARVGEGEFRRVRVRFERVEAKSETGIRIALGLLTGSIRVDAGSDGATTVEREVSVETRAEGKTRLEIDLNADQWMHRASSSSKTVAEAEFAGAVRVNEAR